MGQTIAQKIIAAHLVSGEMKAGAEIALTIDQTLTQDATGTMAYLYLFAYMGEVIQGFFRGLGRLRLTMLASLLQVVLRVVLSYFLIPVWGMYGICVAVASGWVLLVLIEGSYSVRTARALTMEKRED